MLKSLLPLIFLAFCGFHCQRAKHSQDTEIVKHAVADLRNISIAEQPLTLSGDWAITWRQLVSPADTSTSHSFIAFPGLWNNAVVDGKKLSAQGYATYKLIILLPKHRGDLALFIPDMYCSYNLFLNGKLFANNGIVDSIPQNSKPHWVSNTLLLPANVDTLKITLQVSNFSHAKGGITKEIMIGRNESMQLDKERLIASDFMLAGCLFMGGLFFFGLYLFGKNDKAMLFFSLFSMVYSYRIVGSSFYALHSIYPDLDWEVTVRLEYISLFASIYLFLQYVHQLYPQEIPKKLAKYFSIFCLLITAAPIFLPAIVFTQIINPYLFLMFFSMVYVVTIFVKGFINKRPAAEYGLISIAVLMLVQLINNLEYLGYIIPSRSLLFLGHIVFFFLQSMILSFRFSYTLQRAKIEAEQGLKAKSEFLSTMSHEIRTPLNSVIGLTHLMLKNSPRKDQQKQLEVLLFSGNNLLSIVNNILDYSKIEAGKISFEMIEMDIEHILRNIVSGLQNSVDDKGIYLHLKCPEEGLPILLGDPTRLSQVISNMAGNAIKFTSVGGVTIEVVEEEETEDKIVLTFRITDTGIGISKEKQDLIFEQFTQADSSTSRSYGGTGLGLAISKKILELQGIQLKLESEVDKGASFYFTQNFEACKSLPNVQHTNVQEDSTAADDEALQGVRILLVEDNAMNVFVAKSFLESWGAIIDVAENGQEALDMLDLSSHQMILMDLHMPVMDGYEATRKIRETGATIPIIALTASLPSEVAEEVKELGMDDMVLKPFMPDDLYNVVMHFSQVAKSKC